MDDALHPVGSPQTMSLGMPLGPWQPTANRQQLTANSQHIAEGALPNS